MGEARSSNERKNLVVKTLIIAVLLLIAFLSSVIYIFAYPKTTVTLHDDATAAYKVLSQFKVKKYSKLGELAAHEKNGYTFLYWAYEDDSIFNPNAELDMDALSLYATYSRNSYTVTYHVQVYNEDAEQEGYISNEPGYRTRTELFGETVQLPYGTVGNTANGELLPELKDRVGYHFAGWTTKVAEEEVMPATDVYNAGGDFVIPAGDVDLYAYWEKNEYEVVAHTGNEYQMEADGLTPKKDDNGNFIIRNNRVQEVKTLKYLDALSGITTKVQAVLGEQDGLVVDGVNLEDYNEYEFKGWYLDENLTIPANAEYAARVNVVNGVEIPYLEYVDDYGTVYTVDSVLSEDGTKYQFHLYSKWERKSYTVTFNNNHSGSNGKLDPITIYKYDDHYGKFYYHTIDLKEVTTSKYLSSNKGYQFFAWSTTAQATDPDCVTYYQWLQDPISYDANGSIIESDPYYDFFTYRHEVSEDRTFYTLWSRIRSVTFYQKNGANRFNGASFVVEGIAKQWFKLPGSNYVVDAETNATIANSWNVNDYQYFAGWRVGSGTTGDPILEKNANGTDNKEYYWIFSSSSTTSVTICAYWESVQYKIEYYLNDGTDNKLDDVYAAGGKKTYYAGAPARENYIFDGWTTEPVADNTPKSAKTTYTSANSFVPRGSETTIKFYASWTMNFAISYDAGVPDDSVTGTLPTGIQYSKKGSELKMSLSVGSGNALKRVGYTFKGWVLKNQDGSYNTNIFFKAGNSLVFNFAGVDVANGNIQGSCYITGLANNQYPFFMDATATNTVVLYAYWEAKEYTITIYDTATGGTIVQDVKYGQDFDFTNYITLDHVGKKFLGISASENGPIEYSLELGMVISGADIIGDLVFYARYEIREIYIKYMIKAEDAGQLQDMEFTPAYGYSGYGNKPVLYNDTLSLPTPSTYNPNYRFTHWYYIVLEEDGVTETKVPIYTDDRLVYEEDTIILWANYVEETYTLEFKFINPLDPTDVITIDKDENEELFLVTKGSGIPAEYYAFISALLTMYESEKGILEYTLDGLFNTYQGLTYKFVNGQIINTGNYPAIQSSNVLIFQTIWSANDVKFEYYSSEENGAEKKASGYTGQTFESTDSILLEDITFASFNDGESVYRWYIKVETEGDDQGNKLYLDKGAYLVGFKGGFASIADMRKYISWEKVNGRYVGTVKIYAETQQVFTIEYYRINNGTLETVKVDTHIYDGVNNVISLLSSTEALKDFGNGLQLNGWVIYSSNGRVSTLGENGLVSTSYLVLDPAIFSNYKVLCYADFSYNVEYKYLVLSEGSFSQVVLTRESNTLIKDRELDYSNSSNYYTYYTIDSMVTLDADTVENYSANGYEYYGYEIGGVVYPENEIQSGITIEITGHVITVLCYVTTTKTITYTLGSDVTEAFTSSSLIGKTSATYTYVLGYDNNRVIAERVFTSPSDFVDNKITNITIKNISVHKDGYLFSGWQQIRDGMVFADIYKSGDQIYLTDNITFVTYFTTPEAGTIKGYIKYLDVDGKLLAEIDIWNGSTHKVISGDGLGNYDNNIYRTIYSWNYNGVEYKIGENFIIPILIDAGQVFELTAIIKDKYTIVFETYGNGTPERIVTFENVENTLIGVPTLVGDIEFSHWRFELVDDTDGSSRIITIAHNDTIAFKKSDGIVPVKYSCTAMLGGYNLHIIPIRDGIHVYTLEAVALSEITIYLNVDGIAEPYAMTVEYGATFLDPRMLLTEDMKAAETTDRGICAWTTDSSKTDISLYSKEAAAALADNITKITTKNLQLYAVWQTKYTVTYAVETDEFGYKDYTPQSSYYFEGDTVYFDTNVVKSIYYKGFNTVYYDNGTYIVHAASGNDYYYVIGFVATFDGSAITQTYMLEDGSFKMLGNNVTLTPITKTITYRVDFMENAAEIGDAVLNTIYTPNVNKIDLNDYTAVRANFKFLGWHTDADAENPLTNEQVSNLENKNTTLYAVWASNIHISFNYQGAELFKISLNKQGKLLPERLEYYLSIEEETIDNGYLKFKSLNGSDRTYEYGENLLYLSRFVYKSQGYETIESLCAQNFTVSTVITLIFDRVYTIKYYSTNPTDAEATKELVTEAYFTEFGQITSSGIEEFVTATNPTSYENQYYSTSGWVDSNSNFYNFEESISESRLAALILLQNQNTVTMELAWAAKGFEIVLNYTTTPYTTFKAYDTKEAIIANTAWTNIASTNITDDQGSLVTTTSTVTLVYGSPFVIHFDSNVLENYILIGWSTTLYPLGYVGTEASTDILYRIMMEDYILSYSDTVLFDSKFIGNNDVVNLYPVFMPVASHTVHVEATNGKFTYAVSNDESFKTGYMADFAIIEGSSDYSSQEISLYYYNILTVTADQPNNEYFKFGSITSTIGVTSDNTVVVKGTDTGSCTSNDDCHEEIEIKYVIKTITINAKLEYTRELKSSSDTSTVVLSASSSTVTLSYTSNTAAFVIPANSELSAVATLSEYFKLSAITSGENTLSLVNNKLDIMSLALDSNDAAELVFTIAPKSYKVTLELQGGSIGDIEYTSEIFGDGIIVYNNEAFEVVYDAIITLPAPTLTKFVFNNWVVNGTKMNTIEDYEVTSNLNITAYFIQNSYSAEYTLAGSTETVSVIFVGGADLTIGRDENGDLISDNTAIGYTHIGWTERKTEYTNDQTITTEKRDYVFTQVVKGEDITINYVYGATTLASIAVEYGKEFTMPKLSDLTENNVDGMMLYGFATTEAENAPGRKLFALGQEKVKLYEDLGYQIVDNTTPREITVYAVYYQKYTYTFVYGTATYPTTIATETYEISAINIAKEVAAKDLEYTLNTTIPEPPTVNEMFSGYTVAYEINSVTTTVMADGTNPLVVQPGERISLENPKNHEYAANIKYILTPKYDASSHAQEIKLYITNPNNTAENLVVTYEGSDGQTVNAEYYPIRVLLSNKFFVASTPSYVYNKALQTDATVTWTIAANSNTFTTVNASLVAYKLLGFRLTYTAESTTYTKDILFDQPTTGHSIAGGTNYELRPIWDDRFFVKYYDANNLEIVSKTEYYDKGTQLAVDTTVDNPESYNKTGYEFVGYSETANADIRYITDFYRFGQEFAVTDKGYTLYPAYSKIYTINFATNSAVLSANGGDTEAISVTKNETITTYVGGPVITLSDYYTIEYTADGYTFGGYTLTSNKLVNDLESSDLITEYTLNFDDLVDGELYIYIAWSRAGYMVTFKMNAPYKNGIQADSVEYSVEYLHGALVDFADAGLQGKISALEDTYFVFKNFSYAENGDSISSVVVDRFLTIYANFDYTFTVVYNLGTATYKNDGVPRLPEKGTVRGAVGSTATAYSANNNLFLEGFDSLYWTADESSKVNFFDDYGVHTFTVSDLDYANNTYEINLYVVGDTAKYTVNLHYFKNFADIDASYDKMQTMETIDYTQLNYSVMTVENVEYGTEIIEFETAANGRVEVDENEMPVISPYSIFNTQIVSVFNEQTYTYGNKIYQVNNLYDLLFMYYSQGYEGTGTIIINNNIELKMSSIFDFGNMGHYSTQTYDGAGQFVNNIYLIYDLTYYKINTTTYLVDDNAIIANNESLDYKYLNSVTTSFAVGDDGAIYVYNDRNIVMTTIKDMVQFVPTEESAENNIGYNFMGVYSAEYDGDGNIVKFVALSSEDWIKGPANTAYIRKDNSIFIFYSEKQVKVNVQYASPDGTYDQLSLTVLLNNVSAEDRTTVLEDNKGLEIIALYGQVLDLSNNSPMPYNIAYITMIVGGNTIKLETTTLNYELISTDGSELTEITFVIYFEIQLVEVYFSTYSESPFGDGGSFAGEIQSIVYEDALGDQYVITEGVDETYKYCKYDSLYYNYVVEVPYGSKIIAINVQLNNYSVTKWFLNNVEQESLEVIANNDCHLRAEFEANDIIVEFYTSNINGEEFATKINAFTITGIKYGDQITLPYAFIEEELFVSKGWMIGNQLFSWGETTNAVIFGNDQLENNTLKVFADSINKYYLVFANETSGTSLVVPDQYRDRNELVVAEYAIQMPSSTTMYTYVNANNTNDIVIETKSISGVTNVIDSYVVIPEELQYATSLEFGGWATRQSTVVTDMYVFSVNHVTNNARHEIKLSMLNSGMIILKFHITNPENTSDPNKDINLAVIADTSTTFDIPYIQVIYSKEGSLSSFMTPVKSATSAIVQWGSYFANDTDVNLLDNYEFHGWSVVRQSVLTNPSLQYANIEDVSALIYSYGSGSSRTKYNNTQLLAQMNSLLVSEYYEFYAVWEEKHTVVFDADEAGYVNGFRLENKYAQGEVVPLPNNIDKSSTVFYDLQNGTKKLKGWEDSTNSRTILFADCTSGIYTFIVTAENLTFTPVWENGVIVVFNTNFEQWRQYFAATMAANNEGVTSNNILSLVGYPYLTDSAKEVYEYDSYSNANVNGKNYITSYREGSYWSTGEEVPVYKYSISAFTQENIYDLYGAGDYFTLLGWFLDNNSNGTYESAVDVLITSINADGAIVLTLTDEMVSKGILTIYALWEPKNVEVRFYHSQVAAINASEAQNPDDKNLKRYTGTDAASGETGYTVVYVPFGGKITSVSTYADATTIYMYDGYNAFMKDVMKVYNMNVTQQERMFYRFNYWSQIYTNENILNNRETADTPIANVVSNPIMEDLYLYPTFHDQYVVEFKSTLGGYISSSLTQYVIDNENIELATRVKDVLKLDLIDEGYYLNKSNQHIDLLDATTRILKDSIQFKVSEFQINNHYVTIYLHIKLVVKAFLPNYQNLTTQQLGVDQSIDVDVTYNTLSMFTLTAGVLAEYGNPDFAGWYYGNPNDIAYYNNVNGVAYKLNTSDAINTITVKADFSSGMIEYYVTLNNNEPIKLEEVNGVLSICLYAHLVTTTTIKLPDSAIDFATLEYSRNASEYYEITASSNGQKLVYYTAYNSIHAPSFTVNLRHGYTITNVTHLTDEFTANINSEDNVTKEYIDGSDRFRAYINKTTYNDIVTVEGSSTNNLKVVFDFKISKIIKVNKLVFTIYIEYIKFDVNYVYNSKQAVIQYYKGVSFQAFETNADGSLKSEGILSLSDTSNSLYVGDVQPTYNFTVDYQVTVVGDVTTVALTGVPYGSTLQFKLAPISYLDGTNIYGSLKYHFDSWTVSAAGLPSCDQNLVGSFDDAAQKYTPVTFNANSLVKEYTITGEMAQNEISRIVYKFVVPATVGSEWQSLVSTLQQQDSVVESYDATIGYTIAWSVDFTDGLPSGFESIKAGDDITSLLTVMSNKYHEQFNTSIASGTAITLSVLLNYMWFNGNWNTFPSDFNNKICYLDSVTAAGQNILYFDASGEVRLYSSLSEAVLITAYSRVVDYINTSMELSVDRADIALNSVNSVDKVSLNSYQACIMIDTANEVAIKVPYGSVVALEVKPDVASALHSGYMIYNWSANTGSADVEVSTNTVMQFNTKDNKDHFVATGRVKYPEYSLKAKVIVDTYIVNFYNDNGALIKDAGWAEPYRVGYDEELADTYYQYGLTLNAWRYNDLKVPDNQPPFETTFVGLPLFDLDSKANKDSIKFRHSTDVESGVYGQYKYLFSHWSLGTASSSKYIDILKNYTGGQYNTVNLYANYHTNTAIVYTLLDINSNTLVDNNSDIYYLPTVDALSGNFTDMFGNNYNDSLELTSAINWLKVASGGAYLDAGLYVGVPAVAASDSSNFVESTAVSTLRAAQSNTHTTTTISGTSCIQIYPLISYSVYIYNNGVNDNRSVSIETLGGVYSVNMISAGSNIGWLSVNNIISINNNTNIAPIINYIVDSDMQFAYWEVWGDLPTSMFEIPTIEYHVANSQYLLNSNKIINSHYNVKINFYDSGSEYGDLVVYNGATTTVINNPTKLSLFNSSPTKKFIATEDEKDTETDYKKPAESYDITWSNIHIIIEKFSFRIIDEKEIPARVIYSGEFKLNSTYSDVEKIIWTIEFADNPRENINLIGMEGRVGDVQISDNYGAVYISACVANDAQIILEGLVISNANSTVNALYNSKLKFETTYDRYDGGSTMTSNGEETIDGNPWGGRIYFKQFGDPNPTSNSFISIDSSKLTSADKSTLNANTFDYRWEYRKDGAVDYTVLVGGVDVLVDGGPGEKLYIRLVCEWKEFFVSFAVMNTYNAAITPFAFDNVSGYAISNGLNSSGGKVSSTQGANAQAVNFTLLYGDIISYDVANERFVITSTHKNTNATVTIGIDSSSLTNLFSQGWFDFTNKDSYRKIEIEALLIDKEFAAPSGDYANTTPADRTYNFALWLEEKIHTSIVVDQHTTGVVNGHGTIGVQVNNIKSSSTHANLSHGITSAGIPYFTTESTTEYQITGLGASTKLTLSADATDDMTKHVFKNFTYINKSSVEQIMISGGSVKLGNIGVCGNCSVSGAHIHVLYDATNTESQFYVIDTINEIRDVTTTLYGGYSVVKSGSTKIEIYNFWNTKVKTINVHHTTQGTDTASALYPRTNYRINSTASMAVSKGNISISGGVIAFSATPQPVSNTFELTGDNVTKNYILGLEEYVYTVELSLAVDLLKSNGQHEIRTGFDSAYVDDIRYKLDNKLTMSINSGRTVITISGFSYEDNLGIYYDVTNSNYMGMMLGVYNSSDTRYDRLFVKNNGAYSLLGMDIYNNIPQRSGENVIIEAQYYTNDDSALTGTPKKFVSENGNTSYFSCPSKFIESNYALVVRLQERTVSTISFQMTLPYKSDMSNIALRSNMIDLGTTNEYFIVNGTSNGIVFNDGRWSVSNSEIVKFGDERETLTISRGLSVKTTGTKLEFYDGNSAKNMYVDFDSNNLYDFVGWYIIENDGWDVLTPGSDTVGDKTFDIWSPNTSKKITSTKVSVDKDCTIYLVIERAAINITYDTGAWWQNNAKNISDSNNKANYDINTMLRYDWLDENNFSGTSATYPGGLVAVVPSDIGDAEVFDYTTAGATGATSLRQSVLILTEDSPVNSIIRSGVYISYSDDDVMDRVQGMLEGTVSKGTVRKANKFANNSIAIVGGMSTSTEKTTFDVLLQDSHNWYFVGVPTGDAKSTSDYVNVTIHQYTKDEGSGTYGPYSFEKGSMNLVQSLALTLPEDPINSVGVTIAKGTNTRLYSGLYSSSIDGINIPTASYSRIAITLQSHYTASAYATTVEKPMLTGYLICDSSGNEIATIKHKKGATTQDYTDGVATYNISGSDIHIYPIWELINVYKITITDSFGVISMPKTTYVMDGDSATFKQSGFTSVTLNNKVTNSEFTTASYKTFTYGNYVFSGFIDKNIDAAKTSYSTGSDEDYNNYGVLKVTRVNDNHYALDTTAYLNNIYQFTIKPTANVSLQAVWLSVGRTVTYQFIGLNNSGGYTTSGGKPDGSNKGGTYSEGVGYSYIVDGMPVRVAESFSVFAKMNVSNWSPTLNNGLDSRGVLKTKTMAISDGLALQGYYSNTSLTGGKLTKGNVTFLNTIYFKLIHGTNNAQHGIGGTSMYSDSEAERTEYCSSGNHSFDMKLKWYCYHCTGEDVVETKESENYGTYSDDYYVYYDATHCRTGLRCDGCGAIVDYDKIKHSYTDGPYQVSAATCTANKTQRYKCVHCGHGGTATEVSGTALGHIWTSQYKWKNTSTGCIGGYQKKDTCSRCKTSDGWKDQPISADMRQHNYSTTYNYKVKHTESGRVHKECQNKVYTGKDASNKDTYLYCPKVVDDSQSHAYGDDYDISMNTGGGGTDRYYCGGKNKSTYGTSMTLVYIYCELCKEDEARGLEVYPYNTDGVYSFRMVADMLAWTGAGTGCQVYVGMDMFYAGINNRYGHDGTSFFNGNRDTCQQCGVNIDKHGCSSWFYAEGASNYSVSSGWSYYSSRIYRISFSGSGSNYITASMSFPSLTWYNGDKSAKIKLGIWNALVNQRMTGTMAGVTTITPPSGIGASSITR